MAPYEEAVPLSRRFLAWWNRVPEPTYDSSVRAPAEWFWQVVTMIVATIMVLVIVGDAFRRAGVLA
jgi:hypothetical protein